MKRCLNCSKDVQVDTAWCCIECERDWRHRSKDIGPVIPFSCPACGNQVIVRARDASRRKFRSRACFSTNGKVTGLRGERNPNWRGGRSIYYGAVWKAMKEQIRTRDGVCRQCGKTPNENGRALDVHHIQSFRFSGDNSPANLVALCRSCHMRADDHGRKGSAVFLRRAGYTKPLTKRELRDQAARKRAIERAARRREQMAHADELAELGLSLRRIARAVGVSHQTVANWLSDRPARLVS